MTVTRWTAILLVAALVMTPAGLAGTAFAARPEAGTPAAGQHPGPGGWFWQPGSWKVFDAAAEALGLSPEQLFSELHAGRSLAEIATARGVDPKAVRDAVKAARIQAMRDAIEGAVEKGRLTRAQADWLLEGLEQGFLPMGRGFGFGHGRPGAWPGRHAEPHRRVDPSSEG